jgi:ribosomal protein S18 acetylase RimI-like enzyme
LPLQTLDHELVRRLEDAAAAFSVARLEAIADHPGTRLDLRLERFGGAVAPASPAAPELDFVNRIERLDSAEAERLDEILSFYAGLGIDPWLELAPGTALGPITVRLLGFYTVLYGPPGERAVENGVEVRRAEGEQAAEAARILLAGHGVPESVVAAHGLALADAVERVAGRLYVAIVDGQPAAAAALTIADGVGHLASAATLPDFRRRGCQSALVAARSADAARAGCDLISSGAEFGSQSQRNLERAGLRGAYTKPVLRLSSRAARDRAGTA